MPPITTLQHLVGLQHAQRIQTAEHRARLFRRPMADPTRASAMVIDLPVPRCTAASARVA